MVGRASTAFTGRLTPNERCRHYFCRLPIESRLYTTMERTFKFYLSSETTCNFETGPSTFTLTFGSTDKTDPLSVFAFYLSQGTTCALNKPTPGVLTATVNKPPPTTARLRTAGILPWLDYQELLKTTCAELDLACGEFSPSERVTVRDFLACAELPMARIDKEGTSYSLVVTTHGRLLGCRFADSAGAYWVAGVQVPGAWAKVMSLISKHLLPEDQWPSRNIQAFLNAVANLATQNKVAIPEANPGANREGKWFFVCEKDTLAHGEVPQKCLFKIGEPNEPTHVVTSFGRTIKCGGNNNVYRSWTQATAQPLQNLHDFTVCPFAIE